MSRKAERPSSPTPNERARQDPAYQRLRDDRRKQLGLQLKRLRLEDNLDQADLSQKTGIHRAYIGQIEQGRVNLTLDNMWALADAFDVTPGELFLE